MGHSLSKVASITMVDAIEFGRLCVLWGTAQGGTPSISCVYGDGMWQMQLVAGCVTLFFAARTLEEVMGMALARVRRMLVDSMAAVHDQ